mmetsp:Transcript_12218/g.26216  ORF Transcript_12218/g.26216 Transcript_12218/m.26216 type:complete len:93 (-) Transcript_12218:41-319(-)
MTEKHVGERVGVVSVPPGELSLSSLLVQLPLELSLRVRWLSTSLKQSIPRGNYNAFYNKDDPLATMHCGSNAGGVTVHLRVSACSFGTKKRT